MGLQKDAKRDFARIMPRINVLHVVFKNSVKLRMCSQPFFPNSVTVRHFEFSGKDDTDEEFLDFEVLSS